MMVAKITGMPIMEGLNSAENVPYTISSMLSYRAKINSLQELPKDKRPPKNLWDKSYKLDQYLDEVFDVKDKKKNDKFVEFDLDDID